METRINLFLCPDNDCRKSVARVSCEHLGIPIHIFALKSFMPPGKVFNYIFKNQSLPRWIVYLNYASLSAIIVWPLVFFGSIFMFDNPQNLNSTFINFMLINSYPLLLMVLTYISFRIFQFSKLISAVIPTILLFGYFYIIVKYLIPGLG